MTVLCLKCNSDRMEPEPAAAIYTCLACGRKWTKLQLVKAYEEIERLIRTGEL